MKKILLSLVVCIGGSALYGVNIQGSIDKLSSGDSAARGDGRTELKVAFADATAPRTPAADLVAMERVVINSLQSEQLPLSEKLYLFRVLGLYGAEASADAVYPFLGDAEKEIRDSARRALVLIPSDNALGYLLSGLKRGSDTDRAAYVDALATRGDAAIAMDIAAYLKSNNSDLVRDVAIALGKLGNTAAVPALLEVYSSAPADVKPTIEAALLGLGVDETVAYTLAGSGHSAAVRASAFEQLIDMDPTKAKQVLASVIGQNEFIGRPLFFKAALASSSNELQQLVIDCLPKAIEGEQAIIVAAIGENYLKQYEAPLLALMSSESSFLRMSVIHALGNVGGDASFEFLFKAFLADSKNRTIANAVARLNAPSADQAALAEVRDGNDISARIASMKILDLRNVKGASELLNRIAKEESDVEIREAAFKTLENIGTLETIKVFLDLILKGDAQGSAIQRSLKRLSLNYGAPDSQWVAAYLPALESASSAASCEAVVLILDAIEGDQVLEYLEQHVLDMASELRPSALRTLQRFSNVTSGDVWIKVAAYDGCSAADMLTAQKAIIKLLKVDDRGVGAQQVNLAVKAIQQGPTAEFKAAILSVYETPPRYQKRYIKNSFKAIQDDADVGATVQQILGGI